MSFCVLFLCRLGSVMLNHFCFLDRPDPPKFPTVDNIGHDSLALTWKPPAWDGGSNITNYLVEKREHPLSSWIRVGSTRFTSMAISGLSPGHQFEFRVYAENIYGRSDPSDGSGLVKTKDSGKKVVKKKQYEGIYVVGSVHTKCSCRLGS